MPSVEYDTWVIEEARAQNGEEYLRESASEAAMIWLAIFWFWGE